MTKLLEDPALEGELMLPLCDKSIPMEKAKQSKGVLGVNDSGGHFHNQAGFQQLLHILSHVAELYGRIGR